MTQCNMLEAGSKKRVQLIQSICRWSGLANPTMEILLSGAKKLVLNVSQLRFSNTV